MELIELHKDKKTSEHDQVWKDQIFKLVIEPARRSGFVIAYVTETTIAPFGESGPSWKSEHPVCFVQVSFRWWHRLFGISQEQRIEHGIQRLKRKFSKIMSFNKNMDLIRNRFGCDDD